MVVQWVVYSALTRGLRVRATVRKTTESKIKHLKSLPGAATLLEFVELDLVASPQDAFDRAVAGCTLVAHTASPVHANPPKDEYKEFIKPAVEGTLKVLRAVTNAGASVRSVVITSSVVAMGSGYTPDEEDAHGPFSEKDWSIVDKSSAYAKSKTLAERAAWEYWRSLGPNPSWSLCTVNPVLIVGPCLGTNEVGQSMEIIRQLLLRKVPMCPRITFPIVDVRDCADTHILALLAPRDRVEGRRFISSSGTKFTFSEIGRILHDEFAPMGYNPPTTPMPKILAYVVSVFIPALRTLLPAWGRPGPAYDASPSRDVLDVKYRDARTSITLGAHSLVVTGLADRTPGYVAKWKAPGMA